MLDSKWDALLEACEGVMATPQGRGWLDLQRYSLTACEELGDAYQKVAGAIRSALKSLLEDIPALPTLTLMDDTPTANAETRAWLRALVPNAAAPNEADAALAFADISRSRDPRTAALAEARAGRVDRAIALLVRETGSEKSSRGRFLLQTELASIMIGAGHHAVAQPILDELKTRIDTHKLEDWETGEIVARPLALLYKCLELGKGDANARQALYLRICRLDPLQAIGATNGGAAK
jgi:type VI secretion system protein ImpA